MGFIAMDASTEEYSDLATLLLTMAADAGHHVRVVQTVTGGFLVPDDISDALEAPKPPIEAAELTPPAWWSNELPEVGVELGDDGKFYAVHTTDYVAPPALANDQFAPEQAFGLAPEKLQSTAEGTVAVAEADRETIRAWAKDQGLPVADQGRLKQVVIDAYNEAQAE